MGRNIHKLQLLLSSLTLLVIVALCLMPASSSKKISHSIDGKDLFQRYCSGCHVNGGNVVNLNKPVAMSPQLNNLAIFKEYLQHPPGHMPYYEQVVSDREVLKAIYDYCKTLKPYTQS